jgi:hypothetical protein
LKTMENWWNALENHRELWKMEEKRWKTSENNWNIDENCWKKQWKSKEPNPEPKKKQRTVANLIPRPFENGSV